MRVYARDLLSVGTSREPYCLVTRGTYSEPFAAGLVMPDRAHQQQRQSAPAFPSRPAAYFNIGQQTGSSHMSR